MRCLSLAGLGMMVLTLNACGGSEPQEPEAPSPDPVEAAAPAPAPTEVAPSDAAEEDPAPPQLAEADEPVDVPEVAAAPPTPAQPAPASGPQKAPSPEPAEDLTLADAVPEAEPAEPTAEEPAPEEEPEPRGATTYTVSPSKTWIFVVVRFDPKALAVALGHDHMIRATSYQSSIVWHPEDASQCDVSFTIPVANLLPDPPGGRKRAGLDELDAVAARTLGTIQSNFQAKKQLNMAEYPEIRFQSTSCSGTTGSVTVAGNLTMRGVTNAVSIPMSIEEDGEEFRASGRFDTTHTAFGFKPFSNMAGAFRNLDALSFTIDVRAAAE